jgi:Zn-dependent protease with chaperone function
MEWVLLVTISAPLGLAHRSFSNGRPRLTLTLWFTSFLSAGLAAAAALGIAVWVAIETWFSLNEESLGSIGWFETLAVSFLPWIFLALGGIGLALVNQRLEPRIAQAKHVAANLVRGLTPQRSFAGNPLVIIEVPILVAFVVGELGFKKIVISRGAVDALTTEQLDAVLWHEVGHIRGNHNALRRIASFAATLAPFIRASLVFQQEVDRLCELDADNFAKRQISPDALVAAKAKFNF